MTVLQSIEQYFKDCLEFSSRSGYGKVLDDFLTEETGLNSKNTFYVSLNSYEIRFAFENNKLNFDNNAQVWIFTQKDKLEDVVFKINTELNKSNRLETDYGKYRIAITNIVFINDSKEYIQIDLQIIKG